MLRYGAMFDEKGIGVAQTAAFGGLRLCVSGPQLPRTSQKTVGPRYTVYMVFFQTRPR